MTATSNETGSAIEVLPKSVVDRIAAGEVVQRPAAAVKELIENSLDSGCNQICVSIETSKSSLSKITVTDNGRGISRDCLRLAAQRHATSKLRTTDDLKKLSSFGFRGEALASISMVSRLTINSRRQGSKVAYQQTYCDGKPVGAEKPRARKLGTTVLVEDLFYNLPHRKKLKANDEYNKVVSVLQQYSIHVAGIGVGIVCQKNVKNSTKVDLNTSCLSTVQEARAMQDKDDDKKFQQSIRTQATKEAIVQVFGSQLMPYLHELECKWEEKKEDQQQTQSAPDSSSESAAPVAGERCSYTCRGFLTSPSYQQSKHTTLVLFINNRLVECQPLKRTVEDVYSEYSKCKPFLYLSLSVPPEQVDVNVSPTKQEVTLLFLDDVCRDLASHIRRFLSSQGQSFQTNAAVSKVQTNNPYKRKSDDKEKLLSSQQSKKQQFAPSKLIRTNRGTQVGALVPFLVPTQSSQPSQKSSSQLASQSSEALSDKNLTQSSEEKSPSFLSSTQQHHRPDCPSWRMNKDIDMSQPGAFAAVAARCTCRSNKSEPVDALMVRLPRQALSKPKKVVATACSYSSITQLRKRIQKRAIFELQNKLRSACFVGVISPQRSLIQCGEELVLINHYECARELFYQLGLTRFGGGASVAKLGEGGCGCVDVKKLIAQVVQFEEDIAKVAHDDVGVFLSVSETNNILSEQAAACLFDNAQMLEEYFSVVFECNDEGRILLTGLPVLLEGYAPAPHGLPLFLLRLATEVDWTEEKLCFHGICRELGAYYAQLPDDEDLLPHVRHVLFPAISTLLVPSEKIQSYESFRVVTNLSQLYRVFERC